MLKTLKVHWLRVSLGLVVLGFVAMPAARVYMYSVPLITKVTTLDGDDEIDVVSGWGQPNSIVQLFFRQRNFHQGDKDGTGSQFGYGNCGSVTSFVYAGAALTNNFGAFNVNAAGARIPLQPSGVWKNQSRAPCAAGLETQLVAYHGLAPQDNSVAYQNAWRLPLLKWFWVKRTGSGTQNAQARGIVENAWNSVIGLADGPNDGFPDDGKPIDTNDIGYDCEPIGAGPCPKRIEFTSGGATSSSVGWKPAPSIEVRDGTGFGDPDAEFASIVGTFMSNAPGATVIATAKADRPNPQSPNTIKLKISGFSFECDPSQLLDFLPGF